MILKKSEKEIGIMAEGGKILSDILRQVGALVRPGITTNELNRVAEALILNCGAVPSFKGYGGFPSGLCVSVNEVVVHGVPSERVLKVGDIVSLDIGMEYKGFNTDMAVTLPVGNISFKAQKLIKVTKQALKVGIKAIRVGGYFGEIGEAVQKYVQSEKLDVVRDLCGHGIGKSIHEDPQVLNCKEGGASPRIEQGMVFCIEPMVVEGSWRIKKAEDGFGYVTADNSLSCHFEDTIAITKEGIRVLTGY
ncbi:MAG: type I methionyl aminopeptidase [Candidatus Paceibacterota bacterium]|jgi:methionyl aminopeptidase